MEHSKDSAIVGATEIEAEVDGAAVAVAVAVAPLPSVVVVARMRVYGGRRRMMVAPRMTEQPTSVSNERMVPHREDSMTLCARAPLSLALAARLASSPSLCLSPSLVVVI